MQNKRFNKKFGGALSEGKLQLFFNMAHLLWKLSMIHNVTFTFAVVSFSFQIPISALQSQTWNLSKILHTQIFRLKVLHRKSA